jgi:integrase
VTQLSPLIFHGEGKPIGDFRTAWASAWKAAKIPGKLFHDLRRSAVRNLIRAGVPQSVAMEITGHKTDSVFRRYDITSNDDKRRGLRAMQDYLGRGAARPDGENTEKTRTKTKMGWTEPAQPTDFIGCGGRI